MTLALRSRILRLTTHYAVPAAGAQVGLGRTAAYEAALAGDIPVETYGRFKLVPKRKWDRMVRDLYREARADKPLLLNKRKTSTPKSIPSQVATSATPKKSATDKVT